MRNKANRIDSTLSLFRGFHSYLDDIRSPLVLGTDTGDSNRLPQPLNKVALQVIYLLEVWVEVCHLVRWVIQIWPGGVRYSFWRVSVAADRCCDEFG